MKLLIADFISSRFLLVVGRVGGALLVRIPLYARACVKVSNFAPCRSYSIGTSRGRTSGMFLIAPSFASLSLSSLPRSPLWPLTHLKKVGAVRLLSEYAAVLNRFAFLMPIHPLFSQFFRCFVRPSMTYFESVIIIRGQKVGIVVAALITAAISPTWFDCSGPGTRMALLNGLLGLTHIPPPQYAFAFPLLKQAPCYVSP